MTKEASIQAVSKAGQGYHKRYHGIRFWYGLYVGLASVILAILLSIPYIWLQDEGEIPITLQDMQHQVFFELNEAGEFTVRIIELETGDTSRDFFEVVTDPDEAKEFVVIVSWCDSDSIRPPLSEPSARSRSCANSRGARAFPCPLSNSMESNEGGSRDECSVRAVYGWLWHQGLTSIADVIQPPLTMNFAWYFRLLSLIVSIGIMLIFWRAWLPERHIVDQNPIRCTIFRQQRLTRQLHDAMPFFVAMFLMIYIMTTAGSEFLSKMFVSLSLGRLETTLLSALFIALFSIALFHFVSKANTYNLMIMSFLIIAMGLVWGFTVAGRINIDVPGCGTYWYCHSISNTGVQSESGLIFTFTMFTMGWVLWALWQDLAPIILALLKIDNPEVKENRLRYFNISFAISCALIAGIGLFPTLSEAKLFPTLSEAETVSFLSLGLIHFICAVGGILILFLTAKIGVTFFVIRETVSNHFQITTGIFLVIDVIVLAIFVSHKLEKPFIPFNLAALELWLLVSIVIWFYGLVTSILYEIDQKETDPKIVDKILKEHKLELDEKMDAKAESIKQNITQDGFLQKRDKILRELVVKIFPECAKRDWMEKDKYRRKTDFCNST